MSADDDTELRDLVIDSLEKKGVLRKIKAELRATVFLALEENEKDLPDGNGLCTSGVQPELSRFLETEEGIVTLSLVRDFLQQFELDFSLAVLDPEASSPRKCIPRNELGSQLKLSPDKDTCCPLLALLLSRNQLGPPISGKDQNGNATQVTRNSLLEKTVDKVDTVNANLANGSTTGSESKKHTQNISSPPPNQDPFFDDPLPVTKNTSLFYNFTAKPSAPKTNVGVAEIQPVSSLILDHSNDSKDRSDWNLFESGDTPDTGQGKANFGLSSLRDLPSLLKEPAKPKEGRRQWKDTDPEQRQRFMNLTFGSAHTRSENLPSSKSDGGEDKDQAEAEQSDQLEQEQSIEENIEEDLSAIGDDLLISDASSKEENVTVDKSVSSFSKAGDFDYMENLT